jgi:NAD(P)H-dependent FMN reductase
MKNKLSQLASKAGKAHPVIHISPENTDQVSVCLKNKQDWLSMNRFSLVLTNFQSEDGLCASS